VAERITVLAGRQALAHIRDQGLRPGDIGVVAGAAGGPKWLVLGGLDRAVFSSWLTRRTGPVALVGSSIGAWRFSAIAQGMDSGAYDRFEHTYIRQRYSPSPRASEVSRVSREIMDAFLDEDGVRAVLNHPVFRLNVLTVRCRGASSSEDRYLQGASLLAAMTANALNRRLLGLFFCRTLFSDPRGSGDFMAEDGLPMQRVALKPENLKNAVLASGSIPVVMEGVRDPQGAMPGVYRDGGLIDYHLDLPYTTPGLVLFLHYRDRIIPGWFDKLLPWRKPEAENVQKVVLVSPSRDFVSRLPCGRIPDRDDFKVFKGRDSERMRCWQQVVDASRALGDEFMGLVHSGRIRHVIRPLDAG
jgi:hypothetical protein